MIVEELSVFDEAWECSCKVVGVGLTIGRNILARWAYSGLRIVVVFYEV